MSTIMLIMIGTITAIVVGAGVVVALTYGRERPADGQSSDPSQNRVEKDPPPGWDRGAGPEADEPMAPEPSPSRQDEDR